MINKSKAQPRFMALIAPVTYARLVVNIPRRFAYIFVPAIARFYGVPVTDIQSTIALQSGIGATSPLFGTLSERFGRKRVMVAALLSMSFAGLLGALIPQLWLFVAIMIIFGVAKTIYDPTMQAFIGDRIPFSQRGAAIGISELSWAGSLLFTAPLFGFLLDVSTLSVVFTVIALLCLSAAIIIQFTIPSDKPDRTAPRTSRLRSSWAQILRTPSALASMLYVFLIAVGNDIFFINYGVFMEISFELALTALGIVTVVIGAAEIFGEGAVIALSDRYGTKRMAIGAAFLSAITYIALPVIGSSLAIALGGVFIMFLFVEISIVAPLSVFTEVTPQHRAVMMSGIAGCASLGRLIGGALGSTLFATTGNFLLMGIIAAGIATLAGITLFFVHTAD